MTSAIDSSPLAILGAGPTGLEAALAAAERGKPFVLYESGSSVASAVRHWGHVRLFTPWEMNVSPRMRRWLERTGQEVPSGDVCPTGQELVDRVFEPIAQLPEISPHISLGVKVEAVAREGLVKNDEIGTPERDRHRFRLLLQDGTGREWVETAGAVLDCTGTYGQPNSLGDGGVPAPGERALKGRILRHIPDLSNGGGDWGGRTTLLVGGGHSAQTAARGLARLAQDHEGTRVLWALRGRPPVFEGIEDDPLRERASLTAGARRLAEGASPHVEALFGVVVDELEEADGLIRVTLRDEEGNERDVAVDRVLSLTGSVGDHTLYRQLQVHECYATSGPMKLAATLLGEGGGDCLTQTSHGVETLMNPEPSFFILGSKSYGRNNTFLMRVGWEQVDEVMGLLDR